MAGVNNMATTSGFIIGDIEFRKVTATGKYEIQESTFTLGGHAVSESDLIKITRHLLYEFPEAAKESD